MADNEAFEFWCFEDEEYGLVADEVRDRWPELFAICSIERDSDDGEPTSGDVLAWGLASDERVDVVGAGGTMHCKCGSIDGAMRLFGIDAEVGIARHVQA